jgi:HSP20 family molecular chaperone IbpA
MVTQAKWTGLWVTLCAILLAIGCILGYKQLTSQNTARQTLDHMLGDAGATPFSMQPAPQGPQTSLPPKNQLSPDQLDQQADQDFDSLFRQLSKQMDAPLLADGWQGHTTFQIPQVQVHETEKAYELLIPLSNPADDKNIHIQVKPNHIDVSGEFTLTSPDGKQSLGTSSFMKSFTPSQIVIPEQMHKDINGKTLIVTIPKKTPGFIGQPNVLPPVQPNAQDAKRTKPLPPDIQQELQNQSKSYI